MRYVEDTRKGFDKLTGKKPLRYTQPPGTVSELYIPPTGVDWPAVAANPEVPLIITEGELKAVCCTLHGYPCLGLGGVWSFQSTQEGVALLPIFDEFNLDERVVYIVFDSDAVTNPNVVAAEQRLAKRLSERGAYVKVGRLPASEELKKVGLDDYLVLNGVEDFKRYVLDCAFDYEESAVLHELNKKVLYVRKPGFVWDFDLEMELTPAGFKEHAYSNFHYTEKKVTKAGGETLVKVKAASAWLEWPHRNEVKGVIFAPGQERITERGDLNMWSAWGVSAPVPGDVKPWAALLNHLFGKDLTARSWFEAWCAYPLQHPGAKMATAAAIWGPVHGSGKTLVGHTLMRIYGKHSAELKDTDLDDERCEWARNIQFVLADDITARNDRKFMRRLMTMITQKYIRLNPKYVPSYSIPDTINYYYTSNDPDALFMDDADRRFFVHEVSADKFLAYRAYVAWRDSDEGIAALWHHLLNLDITWFDPQAPAPETLGKSSMIELGKSDLGAWVRDLRENGERMLARAGMKGELFTAKELHALYDPSGEKRASPNALARELKRAGFSPPANGSKLHLPTGEQTMAYAILHPMEWKQKSWKEACAHFTQHRPRLTDSKPGKKL